MTEINKDLVSSDAYEKILELLQEMGIKNYTMDIAPGSVAGDNYLGTIAKVEVKGEDDEGKHSSLNLIVKCAPNNDIFRAVVPIRKLYAREVYMYTKVLPEFVKFQEERGVMRPFRSFVKCYKTTMSEKNEAVIMEDMKKLGFGLKSRQEPLNYDHVLVVIREYGKLHGISYALRDQKPEVFRKLAANVENISFQDVDNLSHIQDAMRMHCQRALDALDPVRHKVAYEKIYKFRDTQYEILNHILKSETAGRYSVIGHGDSWVNNVLFKSADSSLEVCLLDWQLARLGSPALDLSYFIFVSTDKKLRDQHYHQLIKEYYKSLCSMVRELGSDPEKLLPFDVLLLHLKKFSVHGLQMAATLLFFMVSEGDEVPNMNNFKNMGDMLENFDYKSKNVEKYQSRIRDVILDFIDYGYEI